MSSQPTGQTSATLDAAYQGVFSQLDALASQTLPLDKPLDKSISPPPSNPPAPLPLHSPVPRSLGTGAADVLPLDAVSERTEPLSDAASRRSSSNGTLRSKASLASISIARRLPLPASPVKGPRPDSSDNGLSGGSLSLSGLTTGTSGPLQPSPKKASASELIRMFEGRGRGSSVGPTQPALAPSTSRVSPLEATAPSSQSAAPGTAPASREQSVSPAVPPGARRPLFTLGRARPPEAGESSSQALVVPPPPSSFRPPPAHVPSPAPSPPRRSPSPLSQVRTMIATWRARTGPTAQRVVGSPGRGSETPRLFGRDRAWNVSIRRRNRQESSGRDALAERSEEHDQPVPGMNDTAVSSPPLPAPQTTSQEPLRTAGAFDRGNLGGGRTPSVRSAHSEPRLLHGEVSGDLEM